VDYYSAYIPMGKCSSIFPSGIYRFESTPCRTKCSLETASRSTVRLG